MVTPAWRGGFSRDACQCWTDKPKRQTHLHNTVCRVAVGPSQAFQLILLRFRWFPDAFCTGKGRDSVPSLWFSLFSSPGSPFALETFNRMALAMSIILENSRETSRQWGHDTAEKINSLSPQGRSQKTQQDTFSASQGHHQVRSSRTTWQSLAGEDRMLLSWAPPSQKARCLIQRSAEKK